MKVPQLGICDESSDFAQLAIVSNQSVVLFGVTFSPILPDCHEQRSISEAVQAYVPEAAAAPLSPVAPPPNSCQSFSVETPIDTQQLAIGGDAYFDGASYYFFHTLILLSQSLCGLILPWAPEICRAQCVATDSNGGLLQ